LKGWSVQVAPYVEWLNPINISLMPITPVTVLTYGNSPDVVLMPNSVVDVNVESDNGILVKLVSNEVMDVVISR
jgi:hypothetical protein